MGMSYVQQPLGLRFQSRVNQLITPPPYPLAKSTAPQDDTVLFSSRLTRTFKLNAKQVGLSLPTGITLPNGVTKKMLLEKILEAHEHALKNKAIGKSFSFDFNAANVRLANGQWVLGSNTENTRDNLVCAERSSILNAKDQAVSQMRLSTLRHAEKAEKAKQGLKATLIALSNAHVLDWQKTICGECQDWLATDSYYGPDTLIASLQKDPKTQQYNILVRQVKDLLPLSNTQTERAVPGIFVGWMKIKASDSAKTSMEKFQITRPQIDQLINDAYKGYVAKTAIHSGKHQGASVLLANGQTAWSGRQEATARWFNDPDLAAAQSLQVSNAYQGSSQPKRITAIAYVGEGQVVKNANLIQLSQAPWGAEDTLVIVARERHIELYTIADFIKEPYLSRGFNYKK